MGYELRCELIHPDVFQTGITIPLIILYDENDDELSANMTIPSTHDCLSASKGCMDLSIVFLQACILSFNKVSAKQSIWVILLQLYWMLFSLFIFQNHHNKGQHVLPIPKCS